MDALAKRLKELKEQGIDLRSVDLEGEVNAIFLQGQVTSAHGIEYRRLREYKKPEVVEMPNESPSSSYTPA